MTMISKQTNKQKKTARLARPTARFSIGCRKEGGVLREFVLGGQGLLNEQQNATASRRTWSHPPQRLTGNRLYSPQYGSVPSSFRECMPRKWARKSNERTNDPRIPKRYVFYLSFLFFGYPNLSNKTNYKEFFMKRDHPRARYQSPDISFSADISFRLLLQLYYVHLSSNYEIFSRRFPNNRMHLFESYNIYSRERVISVVALQLHVALAVQLES